MTDDPCAMPTGYGQTCQLPGDDPHVDGCQLPRCRCSHGPSTHTAGRGQCWSSVCCCEQYTPKEVIA